MEPYASNLLPHRVRSRFIDNGNGLRMHVLEAGFESSRRPAVVLLHGFPELAYCWRKVMPLLAEQGFHVIAPDQRGYGQTTGGDPGYDCNLAAYHPVNLARDIVGLIDALGLKTVAVVGHDFGSPVAGYCASLYPDRFNSVVFMSAPFEGVVSAQEIAEARSGRERIAHELAQLNPPRKHYQDYYCSTAANENMWQAPQGLRNFQRAYYHVKSADWSGNAPGQLPDGSAASLARMPPYYIMPAGSGMAESVAPDAPSNGEVAQNQWLTENELKVFHSEFSRTGYQGGLNWYRAIRTAPPIDLADHPREIQQPTLFISGALDWGTYQKSGALERMQNQICQNHQGTHLILHAGHWVQQEQPEATARLLLEFLNS
ncbi:MAG: alpha/beta hydrolase [Synoicihabitans sp.]